MHYDLGLKEQSVVCEALGRGLQTFVPRKGGIDDLADAETLAIPQRPFLLLPARFHETLDNLRPPILAALQSHLPTKIEGQFQARYAAQVEREVFLETDSRIEAVAEHQAFDASVLQERFDYRTPGLHLLLLRVYQLSDAVFVPENEQTGGCRSWIELPQPHPCEARPVLSDDAFEARVEAVLAAAGVSD